MFLVMSLLAELHFEDGAACYKQGVPTALPADQTDTLHQGGRPLTLPASNVNRIRFEKKSYVSFVFANFTDAHFRSRDLFYERLRRRRALRRPNPILRGHIRNGAHGRRAA